MFKKKRRASAVNAAQIRRRARFLRHTAMGAHSMGIKWLADGGAAYNSQTEAISINYVFFFFFFLRCDSFYWGLNF